MQDRLTRHLPREAEGRLGRRGPRRVAQWVSGLVLGAGLGTSAATPAGAEKPPDGPVDLTLVSPAGCPDAQHINNRVASMLASSGPTTTRPPLVASLVITKEGQQAWTVQIETPGGRAARRMRGRSCQEVVDAAAVTLALAIDPEARSDRPRTELPTAPPPEPSSESRDRSGPRQTDNAARPPAALVDGAPLLAPAPVTNTVNISAPTVDAPAPPSEVVPPPSPDGTAPTSGLPGAGGRQYRQRPSWLIGADLGSDVALMDSPSWAIGGHAGMRISRFEIQARALFHESKEVAMPSQVLKDAGGKFQRIAGALSACLTLVSARDARFAVDGCGTGEISRMSASATGQAVQSTPQSATWVSLGVGPRARWTPKDWGALFAGVDVLVPLSRPDFVFEGVYPPVYTVAPVFALGVLGAELVF